MNIDSKSKNFAGVCDYCGKDNTVVHKFDYPKPMPERFYDMYPEERDKPHPDTFTMCFECLSQLGDSYEQQYG